MEFRYHLKLVNDGWVLREKSDFDAEWDRFFEMAKRYRRVYFVGCPQSPERRTPDG